jgi:hypothetical protein
VNTPLVVPKRKHISLVILTGHKLRESDKAIQFRVYAVNGEPLSEEKTEWFPFSQVDSSMTSHHQDEMDTLTVSQWIVDQKDLVD